MGNAYPQQQVRWGSRLGRFLAYLIDGFLIGLVVGIFYAAGATMAVLAIDADKGTTAPTAYVGMALMVLGLVVAVLYRPWCWVKAGGQTIGYKAMGLRVVRLRDGGPIGWGQALGRFLSYIISGIFGLGYIWILFDGRRQGWHDKLAGTVVISV